MGQKSIGLFKNVVGGHLFYAGKTHFWIKRLRFFIYSKMTQRHKFYEFYLTIGELDTTQVNYYKNIGPPIN